MDRMLDGGQALAVSLPTKGNRTHDRRSGNHEGARGNRCSGRYDVPWPVVKVTFSSKRFKANQEAQADPERRARLILASPDSVKRALFDEEKNAPRRAESFSWCLS